MVCSDVWAANVVEVAVSSTAGCVAAIAAVAWLAADSARAAVPRPALLSLTSERVTVRTCPAFDVKLVSTGTALMDQASANPAPLSVATVATLAAARIVEARAACATRAAFGAVA